MGSGDVLLKYPKFTRGLQQSREYLTTAVKELRLRSLRKELIRLLLQKRVGCNFLSVFYYI